MADALEQIDGPLRTGRLVERRNRFVLAVEFDAGVAEAYLPETGRLTTVLVEDARVVCQPVEDPNRRTAYTALAVHNGAVYVTVEAVRANDLAATAIRQDRLPAFEGWTLERREPPLPEGGRADLLLSRDGRRQYVEVKAVTHAEAGVGKFPDAPTERGRRHLRALTALAEGGTSASALFVSMRPDVTAVRPFRSIDPDFADDLAAAADAGVGLHAVATAFDPPTWRLVAPSLPVDLG